MAVFIQNCAYVIRNPGRIDQDCDLLIAGSRIQAIGKGLPVPEGADLLDGRGCVVMPGLINPHTHLYQNFLKGISGGLALVPWCNEILFPTAGAVRQAMSHDHSRAAYLWSALAGIEMIKGGVTCCIDMDVVYPQVMQAWLDLGFRGIMAYTLANRWIPVGLRSGDEAMKRKTLEFVERFHTPDGLTTVFLAPSTLFLCSDDFMDWAGAQTRRLDLGMQIHVAETAGEVSDLVQETGRRPVEQLAHLGLLDARLSAVHCVHLNAHEIDLLAESGATVVHCPKSNMKLADGIAPVMAMRRQGILVSVATDGCASNDVLDMWEEMRAAVMLARVSQNDAAALGPGDAFGMATREAAKTARVDAGEIQEGKLADIAIIELKGTHLQPVHDQDLLNLLVFCGKASDVRDTIIHGEVVMRNRRITHLDEAALIQEAVAVESELFRMRKDFPTIP